MKKLFYSSLSFFTLLLILSATQISKATHFAGADLTYSYTGTPNTYLVTLKLYRDCCPFCTVFDPSYQVCYSSASLAFQGSTDVTPLAGTGQQIPPSPCVNSPQCYEEYIYQSTITLPQAATDWVFTFNGFARNDAITTLVLPGGQGLAVRAYLNNSSFPTNNSPVFSFIPIQRFCVGNQFYFDQGATDIDNDSLVFSLAPAEGDNTQFNPQTCPFTNITNLTYVAPYTPTDPVASVSGITINQNTGLISFIPALQQIGIICVKVEEYRNGILVGSVKRDIQVVMVAGCNILPPTFDPTIVQNGIFANCGDSTVILSFVEPIQCGSAVPTDIRVTDPNGLPNPVIAATPINCTNGLTDSLLITLYFPLSSDTTYLFTKIGNDGNTFLSICGTQMAEFDSIRVIVNDTSQFITSNANVGCYFTEFTVNFNQEFICGTIAANLSDFTLTDAGGTNIPIASITSTCNPFAQYSYSGQFTFHFSPGVSAAGPLYLVVHTGSDLNTIANKCGTFLTDGDTLAILNVVNNIIVNLGNDITACSTDPVPALDAGNPGVSYTWYLDGNLLSDTTQTITAGTPGTYVVVASFGPGCSGTDTIDVIINQAPVVDFNQPAVINLCTGDPLPVLHAGPSSTNTYQWYYFGTAIPGATDSIYAPSVGGLYSVVVSSGMNCSATDQVEIIINSSLPVDIGPPAITICSDVPIPTLSANVVADTYQWFDISTGAIPGATDSIYTPTQSGTYYVIATSLSGCSGSDTLTLTINSVPFVSIGPDTSICINDIYTLNAHNPGATYQWYDSNGPIAGETDSIYTPTQSGLYSVTVTNAANCSATAQANITIYQSAPIPNVIDQSYCSGSAIPPLSANVSGVNYQWYDNSGTAIPGETNITFQPSTPGTYSVTVSVGTCTASDQGTVTQVSAPSPSLSNVSICSGANFPLLNANANVAGYTYQWYLNNNPIAGATDSTYQTSQSSGFGTYSVIVTNTQSGISCQDSASMTLTQSPGITVALGGSQTICSGDSATLNAQNSGAAYQWSTGATSQIIFVNQSGTYTVTVTDVNGCTGTDNAQVTVNAAPSVSITSDLLIDNNIILVCKDDSFPVLTAVVPAGSSVSWDYLGNTVSTSNTVQVADEAYGIYQVTVTDAILCRSTATIEVAEQSCEIIIHNVFTPNADGKNDVFIIENIETHSNNVIQIFNRWGNKVFDKSNYNNTSVSFKGEDLPDGTYYYIISTPDDGKVYHGTVNKITDAEK